MRKPIESRKTRFQEIPNKSNILANQLVLEQVTDVCGVESQFNQPGSIPLYLLLSFSSCLAQELSDLVGYVDQVNHNWVNISFFYAKMSH